MRRAASRISAMIYPPYDAYIAAHQMRRCIDQGEPLIMTRGSPPKVADCGLGGRLLALQHCWGGGSRLRPQIWRMAQGSARSDQHAAPVIGIRCCPRVVAVMAVMPAVVVVATPAVTVRLRRRRRARKRHR